MGKRGVTRHDGRIDFLKLLHEFCIRVMIVSILVLVESSCSSEILGVAIECSVTVRIVAVASSYIPLTSCFEKENETTALIQEHLRGNLEYSPVQRCLSRVSR